MERLNCPFNLQLQGRLVRVELCFSIGFLRIKILFFCFKVWIFFYRNRSEEEPHMASAVDPAGEPIPTSAVLTAAAKHIQFNCQAENVAFLKCKKKDPNPEKCLDKGRQVTRLKDLHQTQRRWMVTLDACITIQMSLIYVAKSRRNSRTSARWHETFTLIPPSSQ
ncbi:unnamed protein product [Malus baccata var. baccata]